ncbi:kinase-like domain-containing protein [Mycena floridula]|nr:kinase-like domain-containing protein [Mycena floridula]
MVRLAFVKRLLGIRTKLFPNLVRRRLANNRYLFVELLGDGPCGQVYRAVDTSYRLMGEPVFVVIKVLANPEHRFSADGKYLHEKLCLHPNIVTLRERIFDGDYSFMILDDCNRGNLSTVILEQGDYDNKDRRVKKIMLQIIDAVDWCHTHGIYHHDLKPSIILLDHADHVYLADFGLSTDDYVSIELGRGTAAYMSPESFQTQNSNRLPTAHSDIWALGIILVNIITGQGPWEQATKTDYRFEAFLKYPDSLPRTLPMSNAASRILRGILTIDPLARTSLKELRKQIIAVDTFFWTWTEWDQSRRESERRSAGLPTSRLADPVLERR